jgi:hypothetical protein
VAGSDVCVERSSAVDGKQESSVCVGVGGAERHERATACIGEQNKVNFSFFIDFLN